MASEVGNLGSSSKSAYVPFCMKPCEMTEEAKNLESGSSKFKSYLRHHTNLQGMFQVPGTQEHTGMRGWHLLLALYPTKLIFVTSRGASGQCPLQKTRDREKLSPTLLFHGVKLYILTAFLPCQFVTSANSASSRLSQTSLATQIQTMGFSLPLPSLLAIGRAVAPGLRLTDRKHSQ